MLGRRPDGRRLDNIDPIVQFMPFIMKTRNDASNLINDSVDYEPIASYIRKRSLEGMTADVELHVKLKSGAGTTLHFNDLDLSSFSE